MNTNQPTPHKHADLILEWARLMASGEVAAGWWVCKYFNPSRFTDSGDRTCWTNLDHTKWHESFLYEIEKTEHHPDNQKPKLKLVDMSKLPVGAAVMWDSNKAVVIGQCHEGLYVFNGGIGSWQMTKELRIAEQTEFTYWGGGERPMPDGLMVECVTVDYFECGSVTFAEARCVIHSSNFNDLKNIIAYRILGLAEGWTDDPALVEAV